MLIKWIYRHRMVLYGVFIISLAMILVLLKLIQHRHLIYNRCQPNSKKKLLKKEYSYSKLINTI